MITSSVKIKLSIQIDFTSAILCLLKIKLELLSKEKSIPNLLYSFRGNAVILYQHKRYYVNIITLIFGREGQEEVQK